jgi:hypothetical protein
MSALNPCMAMIDRPRLAPLRIAEDREFERRTIRSRSLHKKASTHLPQGVPMPWMARLYRIAWGEAASFTDPFPVAHGRCRRRQRYPRGPDGAPVLASDYLAAGDSATLPVDGHGAGVHCGDGHPRRRSKEGP